MQRQTKAARGERAAVRILASEEVMAEGLEALCRCDPVMARLLAEGAQPTLRRREPGFHGLAWIVMGQQLSVASADAIWRRLVDRFGPLTPAAVEAAPDDALKACGLSAPKVRTLRAVAAAIQAGSLTLDALADLPADSAHAMLTAVKGIGPWTADIYLMFCLGHSDAFAAGDLALQEAARVAYGLTARPSVPELVALAEGWRPWRTVAAKVLWAHYKIVKGRPGVAETAARPPAKTKRVSAAKAAAKPTQRAKERRVAKRKAPARR